MVGKLGLWTVVMHRSSACEFGAGSRGTLAAVASSLLQSFLHLRHFGGHEGTPFAIQRRTVLSSIGGGGKGWCDGRVSEHQLSAGGLEHLELDVGESFDEFHSDLDDLQT